MPSFEKKILRDKYGVDFAVEIPEGREPVILQLSDPQVIDSSQAVPGRLSDREIAYWAKDKKEERCYKYIRHTVENTSPDLILIAGDIAYGEFDHDGSALKEFVEFMDSLCVPWAPVLGNHETESEMGVDWQCQQFKNAEYCLFEQRELTGNGNYTVGIVQAGKLIRVFYMMDSNSGSPSEKTIANGHSQHCSGFGEDQIAWYTKDINDLRAESPDIKISFMFHIPMVAFMKAYEKYGYVYDRSSTVFPINIDELDKTGKDCGIILIPFDAWDYDYAVWNGFKSLGVDSVFVGHDHEVSAGAYYDGIRCQFGLKSSTYDSNIYINEESKPVMGWLPKGTPVIGGTLIKLVPDGNIKEISHYYCKNVEFEK